ncbi:radical SAM protein [candidate division MSBL1 archaeon SCGC-AAA259M10]|uniref:Radical SAM protein n=1 Tax=candidate division MSBL1 archaeon SCGC-AAA259M10 TaxID=1698270 RepID=A0A133V2D5_9EURY|nr:radical SAM protein [candidate division MSBL1 archaeon SCGC-AAA259M10]
MQKPAKFWEKSSGEDVKCVLCPRECNISPENVGYCRARKNIEGELYTLVYGESTSANPDPIEKKPLYHFYPGSRVFSMSTAGCNFECKHCQNWNLSQASVEEIDTEFIEPEEAIERTKKTNCQGIAYTYGEPVIWFEYALDVAKLASEEGLYNVFVTNGYMNLDGWKELKPYLDAMNVDVKAFSDKFYKTICGGASVKPVLETCEWAVDNGIHLEITNLIIPEENDSPEEIRKLCQWIAQDLHPRVPIHFSRFRPMYKMVDKSSTPVSALERALEIAKDEGLEHIYVGNVPGHEADNTYCPECGELLITRHGFSVAKYNLKDHQCPSCGAEINVIGEYKPSSSRFPF